MLWKVLDGIVKVSAVIVLIVVGVPFLWLASGFVYETWNTYLHYYRLTVEIDTPQGIRTGSGVIRAGCSSNADWLPQAEGAHCFAKGDAIYIDLGDGRNLIALLGYGPRGDDTDRVTNIAARAFGKYGGFWYRQAPHWTGSAELKGDLIPALVTFGDLNDPKTVQLIAPGEVSAKFGTGFAFRRAYITMTDEPVTRGIEKKLPWLDRSDQYRTDPQNPFTSTLRFGRIYFARGPQ